MRLVVDSSVWVDFFNDRRSAEVEALDAALGQHDVLIGDLILAEVLQGFRDDRDFRRARSLLRAFPIVGMVGPDMAERSAANYRALRARGVTVRKTIDVLIGTYCITTAVPLLFSDRDFLPLVEHLGLRSALRA